MNQLRKHFGRRLPARLKRVLIGFIGWAVLLVGIIMIPYPGPGWVVVFIGLSILATEFEWARTTHRYAHGKYQSWQTWLNRQAWWVKALFWLLTAMTVAVTLWLLNTYGIFADWLHLDACWLHSPFATALRR